MKLALIGAGGFANEVKAQIGNYEMPCFVDDEYYKPNNLSIFPLSQFDPNSYKILIAIGDPKTRNEMLKRLPKETKFFSFIHPSAQILANDFELGIGSIICAGCIITTNCKIGDHSHLNLLSTIGHDCRIGNFFTTAPGAKISGNCEIGEFVYIGTNASIREKIKICDDVIIGLNSGVVKNITDPGVYIGTPAIKIK